MELGHPEVNRNITVTIGPDTLPWLRKPQKVSLIGWGNGLIGSCIEPGGKLDGIANRLSQDESRIASRLFQQTAISFFQGERGPKIHDLNTTRSDCPVISIMNDKLRVYAAVLKFDGLVSLLKV